jgi:hypothetical protein
MNAVRVDENGALRLDSLMPGEYYEPEVISADEIKLHRVLNPSKSIKLTRMQVLKAIDESKLHFVSTWDALKEETR